MKKVQYSVIITFLALMAAICIFSLFPNKSGFSSFENRKLSGKPELTLSSVFDGKFETGYENYLLDNFLFRNFSVQSYQAYTELFYLDMFRQKEDILMNIDIDSFVAAQKPNSPSDGGVEGNAGDAGDAGDNALASSGTGTSVGTPGTGNPQKAGSTQGSGSMQAAGNPQGSTDSQGMGELQGAGDQGTGEFQSAAGDSQGTSGEQAGAGLQSSLAQQTSGQLSGSTSHSNELQSGTTMGQSPGGQAENPAASGQDAAAQTVSDGEQAQQQMQELVDKRVTDSLIISGDRVMMPTGANNLKAFGEILTKIAEALPGKNIYSITGPTSASFYASKKFSTGSYDQSRAEGIIESAANGVKVVKAYNMLQGHKNENIYFRSDVHWTALGAYYAYTAFCQASGMTPASLKNDFTANTYEPFLGGLYSQIYKQPQAVRLKENPEQLDYYVPNIGHKLTLYKMGNLKAPYGVDGIINTDFSSLGAYKYSCFTWGDQRIEKIDTDAVGGRKLLVVKDSYGSALIPFLVPNYSRIYVIDPKGFNQKGSLSFDAKTLIRDEGIDDVIFCFSIYGSGRSIIQNGLTSLFLK